MPEAKLTELEHFQLTAKYMEIQALQEKQARMVEIRKNAEMAMQMAEGEFNSSKKELAEAFLLKDSIMNKIGKRVKAVGKVETWTANMDHKQPKKSKLTWPEKESEESGGDPE